MKRVASVKKKSKLSVSLMKGDMKTRFALCKSNSDFEASLERNKIYRVVADKSGASHGLIRVVDESGEDYLFPQDLFVKVTLTADLQKLLSANN